MEKYEYLSPAECCPARLQMKASLEKPSPQVYVWAQSYGMEYPFGQFGSAALPMSSACVLPNPRLLTEGAVWEA